MKLRINQCLRSKRGDMMVLATALMIVLLLIFVAVLSMIQTQGIIVSIRGSVEAALDSYTVDMGREIAGSIKSGHDYTAVLDQEQFHEYLKREFPAYQDNTLTVYDEDTGRHTFTLTCKSFDFTDEAGELKTKTVLHLDIPLYYMGVQVAGIDRDMALQSRYNLK